MAPSNCIKFRWNWETSKELNLRHFTSRGKPAKDADRICVKFCVRRKSSKNNSLHSSESYLRIGAVVLLQILMVENWWLVYSRKLPCAWYCHRLENDELRTANCPHSLRIMSLRI